jgi:predicted RNA binding protein YcfA (HicA-like mRNA interferase family)
LNLMFGAILAKAVQVARLQALGFMGVMVLGSHHQAHHLMIANGEPVH